MCQCSGLGTEELLQARRPKLCYCSLISSPRARLYQRSGLLTDANVFSSRNTCPLESGPTRELQLGQQYHLLRKEGRFCIGPLSLYCCQRARQWISRPTFCRLQRRGICLEPTFQPEMWHGLVQEGYKNVNTLLTETLGHNSYVPTLAIRWLDRDRAT